MINESFYSEKAKEIIKNVDCNNKDDSIYSIIGRFKEFLNNYWALRNFEYSLRITLSLVEQIACCTDIYLLSIRGSYSRICPRPNSDFDILLITKNASSLSHVKLKFDNYFDNYSESKIQNKIQKMIKEAKEKIIREKGFDIEISYFVPITPKDPKERLTLYINRPSLLEEKTYYSQYPDTNKKYFKFLYHVKRELETAERSMESIKGIEFVEKIRFEDYKKFGLSEEEAHDISIITDARIAGLNLCREKIVQPRDVEFKNSLITSLYSEIFDNIMYFIK